jgi:hypothetical protein
MPLGRRAIAELTCAVESPAVSASVGQYAARMGETGAQLGEAEIAGDRYGGSPARRRGVAQLAVEIPSPA